MDAATPTVMTDPARELVELCDAIAEGATPHETGEVFLARTFGVDAWSREFFQIIFTISERIELLVKIVSELDLDEDYREEIVNHVRDILRAFSGPNLRKPWMTQGLYHVGSANVQPLKAISGLVRARTAYRKLDQAEVDEMVAQVEDLLGWLSTHQIASEDFIRQALIEGLSQFLFRLRKLKWLGWGYTLNSLREIIAAYLLLERGGSTAGQNPDAEAVLKKVGAVIKGVYDRVQTAQSVVGTGDFMLRAYGLGALWYQGRPVVVGLLTGG